jgi:hypothetical protein
LVKRLDPATILYGLRGLTAIEDSLLALSGLVSNVTRILERGSTVMADTNKLLLLLMPLLVLVALSDPTTVFFFFPDADLLFFDFSFVTFDDIIGFT